MIRSFSDDIRTAMKSRDGTVFLSNEIRVYWNEQGNTAFVGIPVDLTVSPIIRKHIHDVDHVFEKYGLEKFHDPPDPHVSLFWSLGTRLEGPSVANISSPIPESILDDMRVDYDGIKIKIGTEIFSV